MKQTKLTVTALLLTGALGLGAAAAVGTTVNAQLRPDITVVVNDEVQTVMTDANGKIVYPLNYEGTIYLPIRALGDVLNHEANWDGNSQTISLTARTRLPGFSNVEGSEQGMTALEKDLSALPPAADYEGRARQYADFSIRLEDFRDDLTLVYAQIQDDYEMGRASYETYSALRTRLDAVDRRLGTSWTSLKEKTIANTSGYQTAYESLSARLKGLDASTSAAEREISALKSGETYTERLKQFNAQKKVLSPLQTEVRSIFSQMNEDLRQNRLTYPQYNELFGLADKLDGRLKNARATLEAKTISIEDTGKPSVPSGSTDVKSFSDQIAALDTRADQEAKAVRNYKNAQGSSNNKQAYSQIFAKLDALDKEIDRLDDALESAYHAGKLSSADYRALEQSLERVESKVDNADETLDNLLDDDHDDYDDYDDHYDYDYDHDDR